jgi:hypothetical protein
MTFVIFDKIVELFSVRLDENSCPSFLKKFATIGKMDAIPGTKFYE